MRWTEAVHLRAGDILVLVNGEYVVVEKVQHEILEAPVTVNNFQVADYHTYYVSNAGVLVHNTSTQTGTYRIDFDDGYSYIGKGSKSRIQKVKQYAEQGYMCSLRPCLMALYESKKWHKTGTPMPMTRKCECVILLA